MLGTMLRAVQGLVRPVLIGPALIGSSLAGLAAPALAAEPPQPPADIQPAAPTGMVDQPCPPGSPSPYNPQADWPWLCRYRAENAAIDPSHPPQAVFIGDSITEFWGARDPSFFAGRFLDRGISGQTSPQILLRFMADVVALHPRVVHIMAGTNDIAGNTGPNAPIDFKNNIRAMVTLARASHIAVVIGSILPSDHFNWQPALRPAPRIVELNGWLRDYAKAEGAVYADYYAALAGPQGELPPAFSKDGVHPEPAGYALMRPVAERAIAEAMAQPAGNGT